MVARSQSGSVLEPVSVASIDEISVIEYTGSLWVTYETSLDVEALVAIAVILRQGVTDEKYDKVESVWLTIELSPDVDVNIAVVDRVVEIIEAVEVEVSDGRRLVVDDVC